MYSILSKSIIFIFSIILFVGCASFSNKMDELSISKVQIEPLKSSEYEIIGDVVGEATQTWILGINIHGENKSGKLSNSGGFSISSINFTPFILMGGGAGLAALGGDQFTLIGGGIAIAGVAALFMTGGATTEDFALFNAIENAIGADALISPRYERHGTSFWPFYSSETVRVFAKAIRIKTKST